jgi:hypothetical protein
MATEFRPNRKPPVPQERPKQRISRQRRKRLDKDAEYTALMDIYLEQNPICAAPYCYKQSTAIHHIVRGTAGRARSLLNTNTWLGVCGDECHDQLERLSWCEQVEIKQSEVRMTIERLRK